MATEGSLRFRWENFRLWLARVFYGWACRLARQNLNRPWDPEAPGEFGRLQAVRSERIAREWHAKYQTLRKQGCERRASGRVDF